MKSNKIFKMYNMDLTDVESLAGFKIGMGKAAFIENDGMGIAGMLRKITTGNEGLKDRSRNEKHISKIKHAREMQRKKEDKIFYSEIELNQTEEENETKIPEDVIVLPKSFYAELVEEVIPENNTPNSTHYNFVKDI